MNYKSNCGNNTVSVVLFCKLLLSLHPDIIWLIVKVVHDNTDADMFLFCLSFFTYTVNAATKVFSLHVSLS